MATAANQMSLWLSVIELVGPIFSTTGITNFHSERTASARFTRVFTIS